MHTKQVINFSGIYPKSEQSGRGRRGSVSLLYLLLTTFLPNFGPRASKSSPVFDTQNLGISQVGMLKWVDINIFLPHPLREIQFSPSFCMLEKTEAK